VSYVLNRSAGTTCWDMVYGGEFFVCLQIEAKTAKFLVFIIVYCSTLLADFDEAWKKDV
jgi:hypothetical protein